MNKIILAKAKSRKFPEGITLKTHSENVADAAFYLADSTLKKGVYKRSETLERIRLAALLHDIGKATKGFQDMLEKNGDKNKISYGYGHGEIGWAFLREYLNVNLKDLSYIAEAAYWHHGIMKKPGTNCCSVITGKISKEIPLLKRALVELLGEDYLLEKPREKRKSSPFYYHKDNEEINVKNSFLRICVFSADRIVSELEEKKNGSQITKDDIMQEVNRLLKKEQAFSIDKSPYKGQESEKRFEIQKQIVEDCENTTIVKAPAGFGKTLIGLLWASKSDKKLLWVCPRNIIATSLYHSIISELSRMNLNISVELFLSGETQERNRDNVKDFSSDIIITNIDNFLSPTSDNSLVTRSFFINNCDVVFDEYHEFVSTTASFAGFINIMKLRHQEVKSRTLLLSATPICIEYKWDSFTSETKILPNKTEHYPAVHKKKYNLKVVDEIDFVSLEEKNSVFISNSISQAQINKSQNREGYLVHSKFEDAKRKEQYKYLMDRFGKDSKRGASEENVIGTHIIQASLDVSFQNVYESVLSPEATLQRVGRCDRWGDYKNVSNIIIMGMRGGKYNNEASVRGTLYNLELSFRWYESLREKSGQPISLDELYSLYNSFSKQNADDIKTYINERYNESMNRLHELVYPIDFSKPKPKNKSVKNADGNKFRSCGVNLFVIAKKHGKSDEYSDAFSTRIYKESVQEEFGEDNLRRNSYALHKEMMRIMELLHKRQDERFDFSWAVNKRRNKKSFNIVEMINNAKKSNTPYIRFDVVYHEEYGLIEEERLLTFS